MATLALAEQATLSHLPAITGPEVTTLAAQFLALAPLIAAVILLVAALSGGRRLPAAEIVPRRARDRKIGG